MKSQATVRLEQEIEKLSETINQNPADEEILALIEKMKSDQNTVKNALKYADLPEKDKRKLARLVDSVANA
jgi:uncharacterized protein YeeX (DUF496 family)